MRFIEDYAKRRVRLTDERVKHILAEHPEMHEAVKIIQETLSEPRVVAMSRSDPDAMLYYRLYTRTPVGDKFACVVLKGISSDPFVLTSYLTDRVKEGDIVWSNE